MAELTDLVQLMQTRKTAGEPPYTLVLGSDALSMSFLPTFSVKRITDNFSNLSKDERFALLSIYLTRNQGGSYFSLASLVKKGFFDTILTSDPTNEFELALLNNGIAINDFIVIVLGDNEREIATRLHTRTPRIKIIKLRGDLLSRNLNNFIPKDALKKNSLYEKYIFPLVNTDAVFVGVNNNDFDILSYLKSSEGSTWLIQNSQQEKGSFFDAVIQVRLSTKQITIPEITPESFFKKLENQLILISRNESNEAQDIATSAIEENLAKDDLTSKMNISNDPLKIFVSYSHKDEAYKDELIVMLAGLQRRGIIDAWQDRRIEVGDKWFKEIRNAMDECGMALLLVSPDFIASRFIHEEELVHLFQRHVDEGLRVIPIIVRPCMWQSEPLIKDIQVLPRDGKPVISFSKENGDRDQVWTDIAKVIESILDKQNM